MGLEQFGFNVDNRSLMAALEERAGELATLTRFDDEAATVAPDDVHVAVVTRSGKSLSARLAVGADGRQSLCRDAAGIAVTRRDLNQAARTFNIGHSRPHKNISTEFHAPDGPCVFVPLPGDRSTVVWVSSPRETERLIDLEHEELYAAIYGQSRPILS